VLAGIDILTNEFPHDFEICGIDDWAPSLLK